MRAHWTVENREASPFPAGHDRCGFVVLPERGDKPAFVLVEDA